MNPMVYDKAIGKDKSKANPVNGPSGTIGLRDVETPYFLYNRLTDGGEIFKPYVQARSPLPPRKIPGTHFCYRLSRPQRHSVAGRITTIKKSSDLIGNRTRDVPPCSTLREPTTLPRVPPPCVRWHQKHKYA
jgi:hypothetical protein